ncbi:hypothetical protein UPYG_G00330560 [Umbra pygmaea]|uniref:Uncharacterized protein n=1 Tax=Umbra pygmaea TaxID=75934 RepID=A0ABD0VVS7_UMBPY
MGCSTSSHTTAQDTTRQPSGKHQAKHNGPSATGTATDHSGIEKDSGHNPHQATSDTALTGEDPAHTVIQQAGPHLRQQQHPALNNKQPDRDIQLGLL